MQKAILALRGLQFVFSVVVLGLAVTLIKGQVYGSSPTTTKYSSFTGAFGIIVAGFGAAAAFFFDSTSWISGKTVLVMGLDAVSGLLFLAGGIAWAVALKDTQGCSADSSVLLLNDFINQGRTEDNQFGVIPDGERDAKTIEGRLKSNCEKAIADQSIQFVSFAICIVLLGLGFWNWRRVRKGGSYV
ncbi:marvel domain-containing protein [Podospora australis]|uniref:Marvel domain-containing protein n=1 Tax=Podospora australis TaxID=1536484 RepID=A0AAN6WPI4_9PEZI|nr:marvel domain-containing protein [Podospora australis]